MQILITKQIKAVYTTLRKQMWRKHKRHVSFGDLFTDRWETARAYGFGEGTSCYDNVLILDEVKIGKHTWIGPNCILDGSGGLTIGDYCSISAGVQIYSHHNVKKTTSMGNKPTETAAVKIGSGVYVGPQSIIQMGVNIGDKAIIGACSFVNRDVPPNTKVWGVPAKIQD